MGVLSVSGAAVLAVAVLLTPAFPVFVAPAGPVLVAGPCPAWAVAACFAEAAGALSEVVLAGASAFAVDAVDFFTGVFAAGFASGVVLSAGFAGVEVADESCVALELGVCCAGELALCLACAEDKKIVAAARMAATPYTKVDGLTKVGFCILLFWHPPPLRANCLRSNLIKKCGFFKSP